MNQAYFEKWGEIYEKVNKPMQAFAKLNMDTFQDFKSQNLDKILKAKKPEEFFELQVEAFVDQSKRALDYWQKSLEIVQKSTQEISKELHPKKEK